MNKQCYVDVLRITVPGTPCLKGDMEGGRRGNTMVTVNTTDKGRAGPVCIAVRSHNSNTGQVSGYGDKIVLSGVCNGYFSEWIFKSRFLSAFPRVISVFAYKL